MLHTVFAFICIVSCEGAVEQCSCLGENLKFLMLMHLQRNIKTKVVIKIVFLGSYLDENLCLAMALCKCFAQLSQLRPFCCFQSTYCTTILQHCENVQRSVHVVNLDPAAEHFGYPVLAGECIINIFQFFALFHFHALSVIINMTMKFSIILVIKNATIHKTITQATLVQEN